MRWFLPLLLTLALGWLALCCAKHHAAMIEADIGARAAQVADQHPWLGVTVNGRDLLVHGAPPTPAASRIVLEQLRSMRGVRVVTGGWAGTDAAAGKPQLQQATASALTLSATLSATAAEKQPIKLRGTLPSARDANSLNRYLDTHRRSLSVDSELNTDNAASGEQSALLRHAVATGVRGLLRLQHGKLQVDENQITLSGVAPSALSQRSIDADIRRNLPSGYVFRSLIRTAHDRPRVTSKRQALTDVQQAVVTACQTGFDALMRQASINFGNDSATLDDSSEQLLDRIAVQAKACQNTRVLIAGHSDSSGDPAYNIDLSQRRAEAVRQALIARNIAPERLHARGFGGAHPRTSNDTAAGRAANRRIEFTLTYAAAEDTP